VSGRRDYDHDPDAPAANSLVPGGSALVVDEHARVLMQRRPDSGNWSLPGGAMDIGETLGRCVIREVKEETDVLTTNDIFDDGTYCHGPPVTDDMVLAAESAPGVSLPGEYVALLRRRNGDPLQKQCYPTPFATSWAPDHIGAMPRSVS
jgi:NUDIX domain